MWTSCRNEMPWQNPLSANQVKIVPLNKDRGNRRADLVGRQSKGNLLRIRANVVAALCAKFQRHRNNTNRVLQRGLRSIRVRVMRIGWPGQLCHWVCLQPPPMMVDPASQLDRKSTRLNSSHDQISYAV